MCRKIGVVLMSIYMIDILPKRPVRGDYLRIASKFYGVDLVWDDLDHETREEWINAGKKIHAVMPWGNMEEARRKYR